MVFFLHGRLQPTLLPFEFRKGTLMLKELRLVHKNTPSNQNIRFKVNVIRISPIYIWVLHNYNKLICLPLVQDFVVIIMFDQKVRCMALINQESRFFFKLYTLHNVLLHKSNRTIWMFHGKFADEGDKPVNNPNIYNIEGDNMLPPDIQQDFAL